MEHEEGWRRSAGRGRTRTVKLVILLLIGSTVAADLNTNQAQDTTILDKCNPQQYIILSVGGASTILLYSVIINITKPAWWRPVGPI